MRWSGIQTSTNIHSEKGAGDSLLVPDVYSCNLIGRHCRIEIYGNFAWFAENHPTTSPAKSFSADYRKLISRGKSALEFDGQAVRIKYKSITPIFTATWWIKCAYMPFEQCQSASPLAPFPRSHRSAALDCGLGHTSRRKVTTRKIRIEIIRSFCPSQSGNLTTFTVSESKSCILRNFEWHRSRATHEKGGPGWKKCRLKLFCKLDVQLWMIGSPCAVRVFVADGVVFCVCDKISHGLNVLA